MIIARDNYLEANTFDALIDYCKSDFQIVKMGEKEFSVLETPKDLLPLLEVEGHNLILSFIRSAHENFDTDLRIHADHIIEGKKAVLASVLYIEVKDSGTAFYSHKQYGSILPVTVSNEEFDRLIIEDSNDESKWIMTDFISGVPNRLLMYDANMFHSKYPKVIKNGVRKVLVNFYERAEMP